VKAFLAACLAVIVLAAISWSVLNRVQEPVDRAFATPPYTRDPQPSCSRAMRQGALQRILPSCRSCCAKWSSSTLHGA
jgi:hypothetical protein